MKKNILFLIFLLNVISFSAAATDTLDISQTSGGSNNDFYYSAHSWAAQTFVPNQATLTQVSLRMKCISSAICNQSYETMDVEVRDDDGHRLGEIEDFPLSELSSSYAWETLAFDDIIETTPGETYAIYVFYNGSQLSFYPVLYWERATSDVYRAGSSSHREGSLTTTSAYDFTFETYHDPDACLDDSDRCIDTTSWGHQNLDCDWEDVHTCGSGEVCEDAECVASVNGNIADSDIYDSGYHHATSFESGDQIGFYIEVENTGVQDGTVAANYRVMQGSAVVVDDDYDFDIAGGDSTTNTRFYAGTETSSWSGSYTYTLSVSPCSDGNTCSASGSFSVSIPVVDNDGDGYDSSSDCDDSDAFIHPGASEATIDGIDNDCDGSIDEDVPTTTYYEDADGDGYGNAAMAVSAVAQPAGYVTNATDCDDTDENIFPGAAESVADGVDSDCDGDIDEDVPLGTYYEDADGDGYGNASVSQVATSQPIGYVTDRTDCNDTNSSIHPSASEVCGDWADNNCDGQIDEDCSAPSGDICGNGACQPGLGENIITCPADCKLCYSATAVPGCCVDESCYDLWGNTCVEDGCCDTETEDLGCSDCSATSFHEGCSGLVSVIESDGYVYAENNRMVAYAYQLDDETSEVIQPKGFVLVPNIQEILLNDTASHNLMVSSFNGYDVDRWLTDERTTADLAAIANVGVVATTIVDFIGLLPVDVPATEAGLCLSEKMNVADMKTVAGIILSASQSDPSGVLAGVAEFLSQNVDNLAICLWESTLDTAEKEGLIAGLKAVAKVAGDITEVYRAYVIFGKILPTIYDLNEAVSETEATYCISQAGVDDGNCLESVTSESPFTEPSLDSDASGEAGDSEEVGGMGETAVAVSGCELNMLATSSGSLADVLSILFVAITGLKLRRARAH